MTVLPGSSNPHLIRGDVSALRPTQMTVGYREVEQKRKLWARLGKKARTEMLAIHCFPGVIGPKGRHFIVDHHHFCRTLRLGSRSQQNLPSRTKVFTLATLHNARHSR